jgi:hypothetical protein
MPRVQNLGMFFCLVALCGCDRKSPVQMQPYSLDAGWHLLDIHDHSDSVASGGARIVAVVKAGDKVTILSPTPNEYPTTGLLDGNDFHAEIRESGTVVRMAGTLTADNHAEGTVNMLPRDGHEVIATWSLTPADPSSVPPSAGESDVDSDIEVWIMGYQGPIDRMKRVLTDTNYVWNDHAGLVRASKGGKMGFVDKAGDMVIPFEFNTVWDFEEGRARVWVDGGNGFIDAKGAWVIGPFEKLERSLQDFSEGMAGYGVRTGWREAGRGRVAVMTYGFIDHSGTVTIRPQFDRVSEFSEGLAAVRKGDRWGYVDPQGTLVIEPAYESACRFSEGLASVAVGKQWGYIDRLGQFAITPRYEDAYAFRNGEARVHVSPDEPPQAVAAQLNWPTLAHPN